MKAFASEPEESPSARLRLRRPTETPTAQNGFANEDDEAQHWLSILRDGDDEQKIEARTGLAAIFERRGMFAEAVALLSRNIQEGVRTPANLLWLSRIYRAQGNLEDAQRAEAMAALLSPRSPKPVKESRPVGPAIGLVIFGILATALTYWSATHGINDGRYYIWYGPVIAGFVMLARAWKK